MARTVKTPGATTAPVADQADLLKVEDADQATAITESNGERVPITFEQYDALSAENDALQSQYDALLTTFNRMNGDVDALQERIYELKPELKNPNLASDMAARPSRPVSVGGKLTDKGWIV